MTDILPRFRRALLEAIDMLCPSDIRPRNILELPDEILILIFKFVKDNEWADVMATHMTGEYKIKNIRLVCRRFNNISTHMLLRYVCVEMTRSSLARLDEISNHPILRNSVKGIRFLFPFYSSRLAYDTFDFAVSALHKFRREHEHMQPGAGHAGSFDGKSDEQFQDAIGQGKAIMSSWQLFVDKIKYGYERKQNFWHQNPAPLLRAAQAEYRMKYTEQKELRANHTFLKSVSMTLSKMPCATIFQVTDNDRLDGNMGVIRRRNAYYKMVADNKALIKSLTTPHRWDDDEVYKYFYEYPPTEMLFQLPGFLHRAGVTPTRFLYDLVCEDHTSANVPSEADFRDVIKALQELKELQIRRSSSLNSFQWTPQEPDDIGYSGGFIAAHLATNSIRNLDINLEFYWGNKVPPSFSLLRAINPQPYPHLTSLQLQYVTLDILDLKNLFKPILVPLKELHLRNICLVHGTWKSALDVIRTKSPNTSTLKDPSGAECGSLSEEDVEAVFGRQTSAFAVLWDFTSTAEDYIRGYIEGNPLARTALTQSGQH